MHTPACVGASVFPFHACYFRTQYTGKRVFRHVGTCVLVLAVYKERWALISFSDFCVLTSYFICGYTLPIPPRHAHAPSLLPSGPISPVSSSPGHNNRGGTPPVNHGRAATTPKIDARQRQLGPWSDPVAPL